MSMQPTERRLLDGPAALGDELLALCQNFEAEWQRGERPSLAGFIERISAAQRSRGFRELLRVELRCRWVRKEQTSLADYLDRFPDFSLETREVFEAAAAAETVSMQAAVGPPTGAGDADYKAAPSAPWSATRLTRLGDYALLEELGRGGMGVVYRARHVRLDRLVALKLISPAAGDSSALARFEREIRALGKVEHPNLVSALDAREESGQLFVVMPLIEGTDLARLCATRGPLSVAEACEIIRQAALGLEHARSKNLVHRDIKPSNLMLTPEGQVRVLDLGLAAIRNDRAADALTAVGDVMGTADYIAPEQCRDAASVDIRADIYSLGCTLFHILTGRPPYPGPRFASAAAKIAAHLQETFPPIEPIRADIPPVLVRILARMVAKNREDRFATPAEVAQALLSIGDGAEVRRLAGEPHAAIPVHPGNPQQPADPENAATSVQHEWEHQVALELREAEERLNGLLRTQHRDDAAVEEQRARLRELRKREREGRPVAAGEVLAGRYELVDRLGQGGFGEVWRALDHRGHRSVAVKILHPKWHDDESYWRRFRSGVDVMAQLARKSPFIVNVVEPAQTSDGRSFFVMDYFAGGDLDSSLSRGEISQEQVFAGIIHVGEALQVAHENRVIHRDVKPSNILVGDDRSFHLGDFDIAYIPDATIGSASVLRDMRFLAPEVQYHGFPGDARSDLYSLALTAFCALWSEGAQVPVPAYRDPSGFTATLACPSEVQVCLRKALSDDRDARQADVAEFLRELRAALAVAADRQRPTLDEPRRTDGDAHETAVTGAASVETMAFNQLETSDVAPPIGLVINVRKFRQRDGSGPENPDYQIERVLGEGGMGVVFHAIQLSTSRSVALKVMKKPKPGKSADQHAASCQKFVAEAVISADLDHPNIAPVYEVGRDESGSLFIAMKNVIGTPWLEVIRSRSVHENLDVLMRVADTLAFAHSRGVVHRDPKPENVMLGELGEVLLMDWGLSMPMPRFRKSEIIQRTTSMGGTPAYMAPEMATGPIDKIGPWSDIYVLGGVLYEIVTGKPPHQGENAMKCLMAAAKNEIAPTDKTGELMDIALKAMAMNPGDRYKTVQDFQSAVREYLSHTESVTLSTRAEDDLLRARQSQNYEDFQQSVYGFKEAFELWKGNQRAITGLAAARLAYAECALQKEDYDLGLAHVSRDDPQSALLHRKLVIAKTERDASLHRIARVKRFGLFASLIILVLTGSVAAWALMERQRSLEELESSEQRAKANGTWNEPQFLMPPD